MKIAKPILMFFLLLQLTSSAQVQWYQNQDGNNPPPYGTVATTLQPFTSNTFIACYLWSTNNELNTWKISKSNTSGTELKTFYVTGISSTVEFKTGPNNTVYVFERSFTPEYLPKYIVYKLNANLEITAQRSIEFPNGFYIYNVNAFELDDPGNLYFAGDGQYTNAAGGPSPASFVLKTNKNLVNSWRRMDSTETSFTRLHIDRWGRVLVVEDHYTFFPQVRIKRFAYNGQPLSTFNVQNDINRYSLYTSLDDDDNILVYGGKTVGESSQAIYLKRVSRFSGNVVYSKTHFTAPSTQLNDFKIDRHGNIFTLVTQYFGPDNQKCRISRINLATGNISWNRSMQFSADSCNLTRLVMNEHDQFFAIGERRSGAFFSKGFALRIKKSGQLNGNYIAPDSVAFHRSHWLADGIMDNNNQLIAIGNTNDFDTITYSNNYFRSFAVRFGNNNNCYGRGEEEMITATGDNDTDGITAGAAEDETQEETGQAGLNPQLAIYPNPVQNQLTVTNIDPGEYDRIAVYNMQGAVMQLQTVRTTMAKMDISHLPDGVYLLLLRSSGTLKEKSIKFIVRK
ncbi:MAG: T9SS type A sorting domain-containing protein [Ferruginibacter sp.]|nr:T9SS type A sorting domain-containing protein [Chitinophagaceae bacterium]